MMVEKLIAELNDRIEGTYQPPTKDEFNIGSAAIYVALSGIEIPAGERQLVAGITLRPALVEILLPGLLSFAVPVKAGAPHPGPWAALNQSTVSNRAELEIAARSSAVDQPGVRLTLAWLVVALLRLVTGAPIAATFLSDRPLHMLQNAHGRENTSILELSMVQGMQSPRVALTDQQTSWVGKHINSTINLWCCREFQRAFAAFDSCWWHKKGGASVITLWASVETLIRPGRRETTRRLSRALAAFLHKERSDRDRAYAQIAKGYNDRGGTVHDSQVPERDEFRIVYSLAREAFLRTIELGEMPDIEKLIADWKRTQG